MTQLAAAKTVRGGARPRRTIAAAFTVTAVAVGISGCTPDVTKPRVQRTFNQTFTRLYALQQADLGHPDVRAGRFYARASCHEAGHSQTGAGDGWTCVEQWQLRSGRVSAAIYDVSVRTDGCLDATGPAGVVGGSELTGPEGHRFVNPLLQIDACFST